MFSILSKRCGFNALTIKGILVLIMSTGLLFGYSTTNATVSTAVNTKEDRSFAAKTLTMLPMVAFRQPIAPTEKIIFIHTSSTGGTPLHYLVQAMERSGNWPQIKMERFGVPRTPWISNNRLHLGYIGGMQTAWDELKNDPKYCDQYNFISGHFPFGLHEYAHLTNAKYITLIRHPVDREISALNFDYQRGFVAKDEALQYIRGSLDNPQTRTLAGVKYMSGECNAATLARAKENIEKFFLPGGVGVTEDTNAFMQVLASRQGWGDVATTQAQVTGDKLIHTVPKDLQAELLARHKYDFELYVWAKARWYAWKAQNVINKDPAAVQTYFCIPPEYPVTRKGKFLSFDQINKYNAELQKPNELLEVEQMWPPKEDQTSTLTTRP